MIKKQTFTTLMKTLFPEQDIYAHHLSWVQQLGILVVMFFVYFGLGHFVVLEGDLFTDWRLYFGVGNVPVWYPPWTGPILSLLSWPGLIGITLASVTVAALVRSVHPFSFFMTFLTLPVIWTLLLGQIDGLVVLGLLGLPFLAPLALIKPQVAIWGFAARRSYILALSLTLTVSLLLWGLWPINVFSVWEIHGGRYETDIALGLVGLPLAAVLLWLSRGDLDMLMLAGCFVTPYLLPYNLIVMAPAIARLRPKAAALACFLSWLPFSAEWLGPMGWWLGWLFVAWLWGCLASTRYRSTLEAWRHRFIPQATADRP